MGSDGPFLSNPQDKVAKTKRRKKVFIAFGFIESSGMHLQVVRTSVLLSG